MTLIRRGTPRREMIDQLVGLRGEGDFDVRFGHGRRWRMYSGSSASSSGAMCGIAR